MILSLPHEVKLDSLNRDEGFDILKLYEVKIQDVQRSIW